MSNISNIIERVRIKEHLLKILKNDYDFNLSKENLQKDVVEDVIKDDLCPNVDRDFDLGSNHKRWSKGYFAEDIVIGDSFNNQVGLTLDTDYDKSSIRFENNKSIYNSDSPYGGGSITYCQNTNSFVFKIDGEEVMRLGKKGVQ